MGSTDWSLRRIRRLFSNTSSTHRILASRSKTPSTSHTLQAERRSYREVCAFMVLGSKACFLFLSLPLVSLLPHLSSSSSSPHPPSFFDSTHSPRSPLTDRSPSEPQVGTRDTRCQVAQTTTRLTSTSSPSKRFPRRCRRLRLPTSGPANSVLTAITAAAAPSHPLPPQRTAPTHLPLLLLTTTRTITLITITTRTQGCTRCLT